jgi:hypothetical protein
VNCPHIIPLLIPAWAKSVAITASIGPILDAASSRWIVVQQHRGGGRWVDVGGLVASGNGATSTTVHSVKPGISYRLAVNVPRPTYTIVVR